MPNTSATGGYLLPAISPAPQPKQGQTLEDFLQEIVVGLTGLAGANVRPMFQAEPPDPPEASVDWAALRVVNQEPDWSAAFVQGEGDDGVSEMRRHEVLEIMVVFYGPNSASYGSLLRDNILVWQNRQVLRAAEMGLVGTTGPTSVPELVHQRWRQRNDVRLFIKRKIRREYPVLGILDTSQTLELRTDTTIPAGFIEFTQPSWSFAEEDEGVIVSVRRRDGTKGAVSVDIAVGDARIEALPATLTWADGESGIKTFLAQLTEDLIDNFHTTLELVALVGAELGPQNVAFLSVTEYIPTADSTLITADNTVYTADMTT